MLLYIMTLCVYIYIYIYEEVVVCLRGGVVRLPSVVFAGGVMLFGDAAAGDVFSRGLHAAPEVVCYLIFMCLLILLVGVCLLYLYLYAYCYSILL